MAASEIRPRNTAGRRAVALAGAGLLLTLLFIAILLGMAHLFEAPGRSNPDLAATARPATRSVLTRVD